MAKDFVNDDIITPDLATKWDRAAETVATKTTKGLMSGTDKTKLDGVEANANNYKHPTTHPAAVIVQNASNRFVTDTEKTNWNGKASTAVVTTAKSGLMSSADKTKLDGVATRANNYTHPTTHLPAVIVQDASNRFVTDAEKTNWNDKASTAVVTTAKNGLMSSADKTKLEGVATRANNYTHPATHPPTVIAQNASNRFVTDTEKLLWNGKLNGTANAVSATKLLTARTIAGVSFDGSANIKISASDVGAYTKAETDSKVTTVQTNLNTHVNSKANPHGTTKSHVGLGNVDNIQQATKTEFKTHNDDTVRHMTTAERTNWNGKLNANANAVSATRLLTARTIAGVSFNGTANIAIPASNVGAYTRAETDNKINSLLTSEMSGQVIFEGAAYMNDRQEFFYNYNKMKIGLFLMWSGYKAGVGPENSHFSTQIILKEQIKSWPGNSSVLHIGVVNTRMRRKMLYANRARIVGHVDNGTGDNRDFAVRKIIVI